MDAIDQTIEEVVAAGRRKNDAAADAMDVADGKQANKKAETTAITEESKEEIEEILDVGGVVVDQRKEEAIDPKKNNVGEEIADNVQPATNALNCNVNEAVEKLAGNVGKLVGNVGKKTNEESVESAIGNQSEENSDETAVAKQANKETQESKEIEENLDGGTVVVDEREEEAIDPKKNNGGEEISDEVLPPTNEVNFKADEAVGKLVEKVGMKSNEMAEETVIDKLKDCHSEETKSDEPTLLDHLLMNKVDSDLEKKASEYDRLPSATEPTTSEPTTSLVSDQPKAAQNAKAKRTLPKVPPLPQPKKKPRVSCPNDQDVPPGPSTHVTTPTKTNPAQKSLMQDEVAGITEASQMSPESTSSETSTSEAAVSEVQADQAVSQQNPRIKGMVPVPRFLAQKWAQSSAAQSTKRAEELPVPRFLAQKWAQSSEAQAPKRAEENPDSKETVPDDLNLVQDFGAQARKKMDNTEEKSRLESCRKEAALISPEPTTSETSPSEAAVSEVQAESQQVPPLLSVVEMEVTKGMEENMDIVDITKITSDNFWNHFRAMINVQPTEICQRFANRVLEEAMKKGDSELTELSIEHGANMAILIEYLRDRPCPILNDVLDNVICLLGWKMKQAFVSLLMEELWQEVLQEQDLSIFPKDSKNPFHFQCKPKRRIPCCKLFLVFYCCKIYGCGRYGWRQWEANCSMRFEMERLPLLNNRSLPQHVNRKGEKSVAFHIPVFENEKEEKTWNFTIFPPKDMPTDCTLVMKLIHIDTIRL